MLQGINNKKGVSIMIGYVLLISIAVIMGGVMYVWMKSYVPSGEEIECQEGTSLIIKDYSYSCSTKELNLTLFNNGRFNLGGYYIYASNNSNQTLATINVYSYLIETQIPKAYQNYGSVIFNRNNNNTFIPNSQIVHSYNLLNLRTTNFIEISPARYEDYKGRPRFASCGASYKTKQNLVCS
jgi:hypothetical protein